MVSKCASWTVLLARAVVATQLIRASLERFSGIVAGSSARYNPGQTDRHAMFRDLGVLVLPGSSTCLPTVLLACADLPITVPP